MTSRSKTKPEPKVSVNLKRLTTPEETIRQAPNPGFALFELTVRDVRAMGLEVYSEPKWHNISHCEIRGLSTKEHCAELARASRLVFTPSPNRSDGGQAGNKEQP